MGYHIIFRHLPALANLNNNPSLLSLLLVARAKLKKARTVRPKRSNLQLTSMPLFIDTTSSYDPSRGRSGIRPHILWLTQPKSQFTTHLNAFV